MHQCAKRPKNIIGFQRLWEGNTSTSKFSGFMYFTKLLEDLSCDPLYCNKFLGTCILSNIKVPAVLKMDYTSIFLWRIPRLSSTLSIYFVFGKKGPKLINQTNDLNFLPFIIKSPRIHTKAKFTPVIHWQNCPPASCWKFICLV